MLDVDTRTRSRIDQCVERYGDRGRQMDRQFDVNQLFGPQGEFGIVNLQTKLDGATTRLRLRQTVADARGQLTSLVSQVDPSRDAGTQIRCLLFGTPRRAPAAAGTGA